MSGLREALGLLGAGGSPSAEQTHAAVAEIIAGCSPDAVIAAFLTALRVRGETPEALAGAVGAVREASRPWVADRPAVLLDTCGTGGDGAFTVNISTAAALVAATAGVSVAKHGNRSASGNSGSAEVLAHLGIGIEAADETLARALDELGITFLFAPRFHPALRHAAAARGLLPFRTLFNLVGPLANPAQPTHQLIGAPGEGPARLMARTLQQLGTTRAAVVHGADGLDEVTLTGPTRVYWIEAGAIEERAWTPVDFGLGPISGHEALRVSGPAESAERLTAVFAGEAGPVRSMVLANAAAALLVAGRAGSLVEGVKLAARAIDSGGVSDRLARWVALTNRPG